MKIMDQLVERIIARLEEGTAPWVKPWSGGGCPGRNILTNKEYRGINWFSTMVAGYPSPYWMSFDQALLLGGHVNKGEKSTPVIYFNWIVREKDGKEKRIPFVKHRNVFNLAQCQIPEERLPSYAIASLEEKPSILSEEDRIQKADEIVEYWHGKPAIVHNEPQAFYRPFVDLVNMPLYESFLSADRYYATLFHELIHSTGAEHRLNRPGIVQVSHNTFGSQQYGEEELVAEMGAARLCYQAGIDNAVIDQSASYIDSWIRAIKGKPSMLFKAASAADKAATLVLNGAEAGREGEENMWISRTA